MVSPNDYVGVCIRNNSVIPRLVDKVATLQNKLNNKLNNKEKQYVYN